MQRKVDSSAFSINMQRSGVSGKDQGAPGSGPGGRDKEKDGGSSASHMEASKLTNMMGNAHGHNLTCPPSGKSGKKGQAGGSSSSRVRNNSHIANKEHGQQLSDKDTKRRKEGGAPAKSEKKKKTIVLKTDNGSSSNLNGGGSGNDTCTSRNAASSIQDEPTAAAHGSSKDVEAANNPNEPPEEIAQPVPQSVSQSGSQSGSQHVPVAPLDQPGEAESRT